MASCESAAHPRHVDLLVEPRDVLGDRALQQAVVLGDEGDIDTLRVAFQVPPPSRASLPRRALSAHPLRQPR